MVYEYVQAARKSVNVSLRTGINVLKGRVKIGSIMGENRMVIR